MKYNIAFYCKSIPFTADAINLHSSLGGSESALVYMARELVKRDHKVTVFTEFADPEKDVGVYDGVRWESVGNLFPCCEAMDYEIFISLRMAQIMDAPIQAKYKVLWNQDVLSRPKDVAGSIYKTDEMMYVSNWQRQNYEEQLPESVHDIAYVTKNGIDLETVDRNIERDEDGKIIKDKNKLIYISRPERGLAPLLKIFDKMLQSRPHLQLKVARYYSMYEPNPDVKRICDEADKAMESMDNVEYLGNLGKDELYQEIASSNLMVYPGIDTFNETSCIAAIEAQACQTPLICSAKGGLNETMNAFAGAKIQGDAFTDEYHQEFIKHAFYLMDNEKAYQRAQKDGRAWVEGNYQYKDIAGEWEEHFDDFFERRYAENKNKVVENLIHFDDFFAARVADPDCVLPEANESPETYAKNALAISDEIGEGRFRAMLTVARECNPAPARILDFACGNGSLTHDLKTVFPDAEVIGVDYASDLIEKAVVFCKEQETDIEFRVGSFEAVDETEKFDIIMCGEFLEHHDDYKSVIEYMEARLAPEGYIIWSVPHGALHEHLLATSGSVRMGNGRLVELEIRGHKIHWDYSTIHEVFGEKPNFIASHLCHPPTPRGCRTGCFVIRHQQGVTGEVNWDRKIKTMRPYQSLSVCMIAKNESKDLERCLASVERIADEIILCDHGSYDDTVAIAERFGAKVKHMPAFCPDLPAITDMDGNPINIPAPGSFEWARNASIEDAVGDWILWIDADEVLESPLFLRQHLDTSIYEGFVVRQNHLIWDAENRHDKPVRLFRNNRGYRFWGAIHEHCQKDINSPIEPAFELQHTQIMHYGYITEAGRQEKCKDRNLALLMVDRVINPERELGKVLLQRDYLNMVHWEVQKHGQVTPEAEQYLSAIIELYHVNFKDPKERMHDLSFEQYQKALEWLERGIPFNVTIEPASKENLNGAKRFLSHDELQTYVVKETAEALDRSGFIIS